MASCTKNIPTKNYQHLISGFQVTVKNVGDVFLRHSIEHLKTASRDTFHRNTILNIQLELQKLTIN